MELPCYHMLLDVPLLTSKNLPHYLEPMTVRIFKVQNFLHCFRANISVHVQKNSNFKKLKVFLFAFLGRSST